MRLALLHRIIYVNAHVLAVALHRVRHLRAPGPDHSAGAGGPTARPLRSPALRSPRASTNNPQHGRRHGRRLAPLKPPQSRQAVESQTRDLDRRCAGLFSVAPSQQASRLLKAVAIADGHNENPARVQTNLVTCLRELDPVDLVSIVDKRPPLSSARRAIPIHRRQRPRHLPPEIVCPKLFRCGVLPIREPAIGVLALEPIEDGHRTITPIACIPDDVSGGVPQAFLGRVREHLNASHLFSHNPSPTRLTRMGEAHGINRATSTPTLLTVSRRWHGNRHGLTPP